MRMPQEAYMFTQNVVINKKDTIMSLAIGQERINKAR